MPIGFKENPSAKMKRRRLTRILVIVALVPLLVIGLFAGATTAVHYKYRRARETWKTSTLRKLADTPLTNQVTLPELDQIRHPTANLNSCWANDHVILMTNGQYLVYVWWHGANSGFIDHLFLAHGTDNKWYYSTYHFCNGMCGILGEDPAGSIREFCQRYAVHEFDGKSDECLKHTWPTNSN